MQQDSFSQLISVTGLSRASSVRTGRRIVAHFDVDIVGIQIRGCALIRTENDGVAISTPNVNVDHAQRGVRIADAALRSAVTFAAREAYRKLGGSDLPDWAMKQKPPVVETEAA